MFTNVRSDEGVFRTRRLRRGLSGAGKVSGNWGWRIDEGEAGEIQIGQRFFLRLGYSAAAGSSAIESLGWSPVRFFRISALVVPAVAGVAKCRVSIRRGLFGN